MSTMVTCRPEPRPTAAAASTRAAVPERGRSLVRFEGQGVEERDDRFLRDGFEEVPVELAALDGAVGLVMAGHGDEGQGSRRNGLTQPPRGLRPAHPRHRD